MFMSNMTMTSFSCCVYQLTGNETYRNQGLQMLHAFQNDVAAAGIAHAGFLNGAEDFISPLQAVLVAGDDEALAHSLRRCILERCLPTRTLTTYRRGVALPDGHPAAGKNWFAGWP